jgi:hypothetical protein
MGGAGPATPPRLHGAVLGTAAYDEAGLLASLDYANATTWPPSTTTALFATDCHPGLLRFPALA